MIDTILIIGIVIGVNYFAWWLIEKDKIQWKKKQ